MKLLDEIIDLASNDSGSVSTLLRKCLVLAHALGNERLKSWAEKELTGYDTGDTKLPDYRRTTAPAKGFFVGGFGAQINNQPIPSAMLGKEHRGFAEFAELLEPIASYENVKPSSQFMIEWPANLTALYQATFFGGDYALNRAWQEIPGTVLIGLVDNIKTRVLRLALELKDAVRADAGRLDALPKEKVDQKVMMYLLGMKPRA